MCFSCIQQRAWKDKKIYYMGIRETNAGIFTLQQSKEPSSPGIQEAGAETQPFAPRLVTPQQPHSGEMQNLFRMQNLMWPGTARPPEVWLAKISLGYRQCCLSRGVQDPGNSWVLVTVGRGAELPAPVLTRPDPKKAGLAGAESCFQSSGRTSCEVWVRQRPWACRQVFFWRESVVNTRG